MCFVCVFCVAKHALFVGKHTCLCVCVCVCVRVCERVGVRIDMMCVCLFILPCFECTLQNK